MAQAVATSGSSRSALTADVAAGLLCGVICVPYAASYAALLFTGPLAAHLGAGISVVLLTAAIGALVSSRLGAFPFGVANPDANTTAILAAVLGAVAAQVAAPGDVLASVLAASCVATIVTGAVLLALGGFRAGRWVRYFPYPVMGGYLAATGWLLSSGALKVAAGKSLSLETLRDVLAHGPDPRLVAGVAIGIVFLAVQRAIAKPLAIPIALAVVSAAVLIGLQIAGFDLAKARQAGWLFNDLGSTRWFPPWETLASSHVHWDAIAGQAGGIAALVAVAAITSLLTAAGLEVATERDADLDRELRSGGLTSLFSALSGGYIAILSISRTLVAYRSGARGRLTGVIIAAVCAAAALGGSQLIAYVPRVALAGLLLSVGLGLLYEWLILGFRRLHREDYGVVLLILGTTIGFGFAVGVAVGLLAACAGFAVKYASTHVIRRELSGTEIRSAFERPEEDRTLLDEHGGALLALQFQGFLFFGSAYAILDHLRTRFEKTPGLKFLVLDFSAVAGLDTSAAMTFQKIRQMALRRGCMLAFVGLAPRLEATLAEAACFADGVAVRLADLDHGLEWCEDRLLAILRGDAHGPGGALERRLAADLGDPEAVARVRAILERRTFAPGEYVFLEGDPSDSLYLVESGRVSVVLERDGAPLRLRTYLGGTVVGEMGLYTTEPRTASVVAEEPSVLLRLSSAAFAQLCRTDVEVANSLHRMIVRFLAHRLGRANAEKAALRRIGAAT